MLVITALVGTRDLGQEVYIALTKADTGRGIVAGLRRRHRHHRRPADRRRRPRTRAAGAAEQGGRHDRPRNRPCARAAALAGPVDPSRSTAASPTSISWSRTAAALRGAHRRRHPGAPGDALQRAGGQPRRPCRRVSLRPWSPRTRRAGARFIEGRTLAPRTSATRRHARARAAAGRPLPPRDPEASARPGWPSGCSTSSATTPAPDRGRQPPRRPAAGPARAAAAGGGGRPGRDGVRPQRPAAGQLHRRRRAALADRLGLCRLQQPAVRPRRAGLQQRADRRRRTGMLETTSTAPPMRPQAPLPRDEMRRRCCARRCGRMVSEIHSDLDFDFAAYTARTWRVPSGLCRLQQS
jgi:hypothetical protein